jgi:uncharacterized OsmC-like protein
VRLFTHTQKKKKKMRRTLHVASGVVGKNAKTYHLRASGSGSLATARTGSGHVVSTDVPTSSGGKDSAAEPVYHLLAALVGCKTATCTFVARKMKLNVRELQFELSAERDQRGSLSLPIENDPEVSAALSEITGVCYVDAPGITDEELAILARQTHLRCPVACMIESSGTKLEIKFARLPSDEELRPGGDGAFVM